MASLPINPGRASALPLDLLLSAIPSLPRSFLERLVERAIDSMDRDDGDLDIESNGDELDGSAGEDDFCPHNTGAILYPGCPCSDPDTAADDRGCDDINDDREEEYCAVPIYGIDQRHILVGPDHMLLRS